MRPLLFLLAATVVLAACDASTPAASAVDDEQALVARTAAPAALTFSAFDPFADAVVTDGVVDGGQGFPDPAGMLGAPQVLDPAKSPPVTGVGVGGSVVLDLGAGEAVVDGPGPDLLVIESDGSVLAAGFGFPEPVELAVSDSPAGPFVSLGVSDGTGLFDLAGSGLWTARYVRLVDAGGFPPSGIDITAVAALNVEGASFRLTPTTLDRDGRRPHVTGHVSTPAGFDLAAARIVVATTVDAPAGPGPRPVLSSVSIDGAPRGRGGTVQFPADAFFDAAPDGEVVVVVELTSAGGETLFLLDTVTVL